jgi:hypothetical protein
MANAAAGNISIRTTCAGPRAPTRRRAPAPAMPSATPCTYLRRGSRTSWSRAARGRLHAPVHRRVHDHEGALDPQRRPEQGQPALRPHRDGFVLAEGGAMFVLETEEHAKARGATIYCRTLGTGNSSDAGAHHRPRPRGRGAARSMRKCASGRGPERRPRSTTSTPTAPARPLGDKAEVAAVLRVFGDHARKSAGGHLLMSSTKSMHGHCLGASGAVELIACIHAVRDGVIPPTINLENPTRVRGCRPGASSRPRAASEVRHEQHLRFRRSQCDAHRRPIREGIIAGETAICSIEQGGCGTAGTRSTTLRQNASFEEVAFLLLEGHKPSSARTGAVQAGDGRRACRCLPGGDDFIESAGGWLASGRAVPMDVLRTAVSILGHTWIRTPGQLGPPRTCARPSACSRRSRRSSGTCRT